MLKKFMFVLVVAGLMLSLSGTAFCEKAEVTYLISPGPSITAETYRKLEIAFEIANPNIDLVYETTAAPEYQNQILLRGAMGDLPDVWAGTYDQRFDKYVKSGMLLPLNSLMEAAGIYVSKYPWFEPGRRGGKFYAYPHEVGCRGFINYNKEMFDEAGVPYPTDDLTWEEFREICRKLTVRDEEGNVTRYACLNKYPMYDFAFAFGGRKVDNVRQPTEALFGHPEYLAGMKEYLDMVDEGVMMPRRRFDALGGSKPKIFGEGKVAIVVTGLGYGGWFKDCPFAWDVVMLPLQENGGYQGGPSCHHISSATENPTEAFQFLSWLTLSEEALILKQENYGANSIIPMSPDLEEAFLKIAEDRTPDNWRCTYIAREHIVPGMVFEGVSDFFPIWWETVMDIVYGRQPLESLIEAEKEGQKILDQLPWNK